MPYTSISAIAVDSRKRVWFGSNCCDTGLDSANGLAMLDGATWVTYTVDNSGLTYSRTATLAADAQGRIWIGQTDFTGGISAPERGPGTLTPSTLPGQVMLNVFEDGGSSARSDDRWCTYYVGGGSCTSPSITAGLPSNHVSAIAAARERIWFGTGDTFYGAGVATLQLNWQTFTTGDGMNSNAVQALWADDGTNELWAGGPNGVNRFDGSNWAFYPLATGGYFSSGIRALHQDDAGRLWAAEGLINGPSYGAVWLYMPNSNTWQSYLAPGTGTLNGLSSDALGQNSRLWIATSEALKVFNVRTSSWVTFTTGNSPLVSNNVKAVTRDHAGWMWMGTDGGLSVYTGTGWLSYTVASTGGGLLSDNVRALAGDALGRMWVGTSAGVSVISGGNWTAYTAANTGGGLRSNFVQGIALDPAGRVWVATDNGLSMFDGTRWTWLNRYTSGLVADDLRAIASDNQDGVWVGTPQGLSVRGVMPSVIALPAPVFDSFSPGSGPVNTSVNIVGVNFAGGLETNRVYFTGPGGTYAEAQIQQRSSN
ncbi:MAG TPA: two-component regulator propeller domain-containing protein, partial [Chloroflexota bacterium]|nr:two-component regulator propeller domain-containing protein [Chloroflexota bacterium]